MLKPFYYFCVLLFLASFTGCVSQQSLTTTSTDHSTTEPTEALNDVPLALALHINDKEFLLKEEYFINNYAEHSCLIATSKPIPPNIWDTLAEGYGLPPTPKDARIEREFNWYKNNPRYIARVSYRANSFFYHIVEELKKNDMPLELALLPIVESAFDPFAYSHGSASGIWQFIPATGKKFGLQQDWWYDGRRDVNASTQAAIDLLQYLYKRFDGDWYHAIAAYNSGEGRVRNAIRRNKMAGKPTDFWHLKLPEETEAYVPKLVALAKIVKDAKKYNMPLSPIENKPVLKLVTLENQIDLAVAASMAGISINELYRLNAGFNRWATGPGGPYQLMLPLDSAETFSKKLKEHESSAINWNRYKVQSGDVLSVLAKKHNTSTDAIKKINKLNSDTIRVGQYLLIPTGVKKPDFYSISPQQYREQKNNAANGLLRTEHKVVAGDSLWKVAKTHGVSIEKLAKWNSMTSKDTLRLNQTLVIWQNKTKVNAPLLWEKDKTIRRVGYVVRNGDSLYVIAKKFNVQVDEIMKWNSLTKHKYLQPGQHLTLFVDVAQVQ